MVCRIITCLGLVIVLSVFSGCTVITTAVVVTSTVVESAIDVVDVVTPDIVDD